LYINITDYTTVSKKAGNFVNINPYKYLDTG